MQIILLKSQAIYLREIMINLNKKSKLVRKTKKLQYRMAIRQDKTVYSKVKIIIKRRY